MLHCKVKKNKSAQIHIKCILYTFQLSQIYTSLLYFVCYDSWLTYSFLEKPTHKPKTQL